MFVTTPAAPYVDRNGVVLTGRLVRKAIPGDGPFFWIEGPSVWSVNAIARRDGTTLIEFRYECDGSCGTVNPSQVLGSKA